MTEENDCRAEGIGVSQQGSSRPSLTGDQLTLADANWVSASDGNEPDAGVGGMRTIDPLLKLGATGSGH